MGHGSLRIDKVDHHLGRAHEIKQTLLPWTMALTRLAATNSESQSIMDGGIVSKIYAPAKMVSLILWKQNINSNRFSNNSQAWQYICEEMRQFNCGMI